MANYKGHYIMIWKLGEIFKAICLHLFFLPAIFIAWLWGKLTGKKK